MEAEAVREDRVCSAAPLGNLNRFSEMFFFEQGRSLGDTDVAVVDFSTLPWLSLRSGGGNHFLPLKTRLLFPGELVFVPLLASFAILFSASPAGTDVDAF